MAADVARQAVFARRTIEAAGGRVAPDVTVAELAEHGRRLERGEARTAVPRELTPDGRRDAQLAKPSGAERAAKVASAAPGAAGAAATVAGTTVHEARSLKSTASYPVGRAAHAVAAPIREISEGVVGPATGGVVQGDSAVGRLLGSVLVGLGVLIVGSMVIKKDFAINIGGPTAPVVPGPVVNAGIAAAQGALSGAVAGLQYTPLYKGPGTVVVQAAPAPTHGALP